MPPTIVSSSVLVTDGATIHKPLMLHRNYHSREKLQTIDESRSTSGSYSLQPSPTTNTFIVSQCFPVGFFCSNLYLHRWLFWLQLEKVLSGERIEMAVKRLMEKEIKVERLGRRRRKWRKKLGELCKKEKFGYKD